MGDIRVHLIIEGRVQGVFFRETTRKTAVSLGVNGWVRNRRDGSVEVVAEGPEKEVRELVRWCRSGPPTARVDRMQEDFEESRGEFSFFDVAY